MSIVTLTQSKQHIFNELIVIPVLFNWIALLLQLYLGFMHLVIRDMEQLQTPKYYDYAISRIPLLPLSSSQSQLH